MPHSFTCVGHTRMNFWKSWRTLPKPALATLRFLWRSSQGRKRVPNYSRRTFSWLRPRFSHSRKLSRFWNRSGRLPGKHPEAPDSQTDLINLKTKVDAGADFITTQLFFDNQVYFDFVTQCEAMGITVPILPGLLPVLSLGQVRRFCDMCESRLLPASSKALKPNPRKNKTRRGPNGHSNRLRDCSPEKPRISPLRSQQIRQHPRNT